MAIAAIPEIIADFNMYLSGNKLVGVTGEVTLPELEGITEAISGPGILGEIEAGAPGHYSSIEQEIPFRIFNKDATKLISPASPVELTLRGAQQYTKPSTGAIDHMGMRVVFRGKCKNVNLGTVKQRGAMDSAVTLEVTYYLFELDGEKIVELDKLNPKFVVNGEDLLEKVRSLC